MITLSDTIQQMKLALKNNTLDITAKVSLLIITAALVIVFITLLKPTSKQQVQVSTNYPTTYQLAFGTTSIQLLFLEGHSTNSAISYNSCQEIPASSYISESEYIDILQFRLYDSNCPSLPSRSVNYLFAAPASESHIIKLKDARVVKKMELYIGRYLEYVENATVCTNGCQDYESRAAIILLNGEHQGKVLQIIDLQNKTTDLTAIAKSIAIK